jgi:hypothetical protein
MKVFTHVLFTWLLANAILPVIWFLIDIINFPGDLNPDNFSPEAVAFMLSIFLISLPSFLVSLLLIKPIISSRYSGFEKLFLWCITTFCIATLNIILPIVIITGGLFFLYDELGFLIIPVLASVFISITIRYKYFIKLTKTYHHENTLV